MLFDGLKALRAYDMFHAAGILRGCFGVNAKADQPSGEELVTLIYFFCYFLICPFPKIIYLVVVSAFSPIGPLA